MFTNWTWPNFFSRMHDVFVPLALVMASPQVAAIVAGFFGPNAPLVIGAVAALAHLGDSQVNGGIPPKA